VGGREIGFMYGQYKRLRSENTGVLTGKGMNWGGSLIRPEATGFGAVYYGDEMLKVQGESYKGKRISVSGFGNVTWGVCMKAAELGAKVVTISGPDGYILDEEGVNTPEKWEYLLELRASNNDVVAPYAEEFDAKFFPGEKPWGVKVDMAFPCAIQNELNSDDAQALIDNGCKYVVETSNMGCTADAVSKFHEAKVLFAPGKAANAGGVAVSGLEMSQNGMKLSWPKEEVDERLKHIMSSIHHAGMTYGQDETGYINYVKGSNIAGFKKVADAMLDLGF
ncbi:MAG: glutamate dehydrogenase, partial [Victivallales bacterium]|nr:glutamate dehydrogenase [Victivallales bacterium]